MTAAQEAVQHGLRAHRADPEAAQRLVLLGVQARLALARGDPARAWTLLDEARHERSARQHLPALDQWLTLLDAEIDLATGRPEQAEQRYVDLRPDETAGSGLRVCLAAAALARRDPRRAEELLTAAPSTRSDTVAMVGAGIVRALVADAQGHSTRAVDLLTDAVRLAEREGIRRPFITLSSNRLDELLDRVRLLAQVLFPGSAGAEDAQARAALLLGGQVKLQAYTLAYADGYVAIAFVAAIAVILIACMKPMKIYFDSNSPTPTK